MLAVHIQALEQALSDNDQVLSGRVVDFDDHVGLGIIDYGEGELPFHCVNIADGSRTIAVDTKVSFIKFLHPRGRYEAKEIVKQTV